MNGDIFKDFDVFVENGQLKIVRKQKDENKANTSVQQEIEELKKQIDAALDNKDKDLFLILCKRYKAMVQKGA